MTDEIGMELFADVVSIPHANKVMKARTNPKTLALLHRHSKNQLLLYAADMAREVDRLQIELGDMKRVLISVEGLARDNRDKADRFRDRVRMLELQTERWQTLFNMVSEKYVREQPEGVQNMTWQEVSDQDGYER